MLQASLEELVGPVMGLNLQPQPDPMTASLPNDSMDFNTYCISLINFRSATLLVYNNGDIDADLAKMLRKKANQLMRNKGCPSKCESKSICVERVEKKTTREITRSQSWSSRQYICSIVFIYSCERMLRCIHMSVNFHNS